MGITIGRETGTGDVHLVVIVGARPQFIKAAAVSRAIGEHTDLSETVVHTGQHFDSYMSEVFFRELEMREPAYNLGVHGGGHGTMTGRMLEALEPVLEGERPDAVVSMGIPTLPWQARWLPEN